MLRKLLGPNVHYKSILNLILNYMQLISFTKFFNCSNTSIPTFAIVYK